MRYVFINLVAFLAMTIAVAAQDIAMPSGAQLTLENSSALDAYALPIGPFGDGQVPVEVFEGKTLEQVWRVTGQQLTTLQLLSPMRQQIEQAGFETRLDCDADLCGGFDFRFHIKVLPAPEMYVDLTDFRFFSASDGDGAAISILISRSSSAAFIQVIRVGTATQGVAKVDPGLTPKPVVVAGPFGQTLESHGRIVLEDLAFETGASTLGSGNFESLESIAGYLGNNPKRKIAIVGHTDSVGSLEGNINLSRKRATSVLERLVSDFGVNRSQLEAGGMGYLAPIISNLTAEGRKANRRVEAVLVSTE